MALATGVPDVVVEGEGEVTLLELMEAVDTGRDLGTVAGIGRLVDDRPAWTERRPLISKVDELPFPDFSDFDWDMYPNPYEIPIMTSRGCVLSCAFCYETVYWKRFRTQSAERIVAEIQHQIAQHPGREAVEASQARFGMAFADSLVNGHLGGLKRMAELLIESDTDIYWNGQATINTKMDDEFFAKLRASGCSGLSFGLESGSASVLESMGKRFQIDEATAFFDRVHRSGIELVVNIMVGFPTETRGNFLETLRFLARIRRMIYMVNNVGATAVVGGSRLHQSPQQFGVVPSDAGQWADAVNLEWTSDAAGDERNRLRRVKLLHAWMTLMRIPHQRIGPPSRLATMFGRGSKDLVVNEPESSNPDAPPRRSLSATAVANRIDELSASVGVEPLLIRFASGQVTRTGGEPSWASALDVPTWSGLTLDEVRRRLTSSLGEHVTVSQAEDADGVVEVRVAAVGRPASGATALRIRVFPKCQEESDQVSGGRPEQADQRRAARPPARAQ